MSRYADNLYPPFDGYPRPWAVMSRAGTFYVARQMAPYDLARPGMLMQPLVGPSGRKVSFRSRSAAQTRADELNNRTKQETTDG